MFTTSIHSGLYECGVCERTYMSTSKEVIIQQGTHQTRTPDRNGHLVSGLDTSTHLNGSVPDSIIRAISRHNPLGTLIPGEFPLGELTIAELKHFGRVHDGLAAHAVRFSTLIEYGGSRSVLEMFGKPTYGKKSDEANELTLKDDSQFTIFDNFKTVLLAKPLENGGTELLVLSNAAVKEASEKDGTKAFDIICPPLSPKPGIGENPNRRKIESVTIVHINSKGSTIRKIDMQRLPANQDEENMHIALALGFTDKIDAVSDPVYDKRQDALGRYEPPLILDREDLVEAVDEITADVDGDTKEVFREIFDDASKNAKRKAFERALLETRMTIPTGAGRVEFARFHSDDLSANDRTPIIVLPSYTTHIKQMRHVIQSALDKGRNVVALSYPDQRKRDDLTRNPYRNNHLPETYADEANALLQVMAKTGTKSADVIAPSHSAIIATRAASALDLGDGPKIDNLILINPGGLYENDTISELEKRTYDALVSRGTLSTANKGAFLKQSEAERDAHLPSISALLPILDASGHGITIIQAENDNIFPLEKLREGLKSSLDMPHGDSNIIVKIVRGDHFNFLEENPPIQKAIEDTLEKL